MLSNFITRSDLNFSAPFIAFLGKMSTFFMRMLLVLLVTAMTIPQQSEAEWEEWCIADEQTPEDELKAALDWACSNGADCSKIQPDQPCFLPNTTRDHASFAFNSYYQTYKHKGASCYFNGAARITELDPSHGSCRYEYVRLEAQRPPILYHFSTRRRRRPISEIAPRRWGCT